MERKSFRQLQGLPSAVATGPAAMTNSEPVQRPYLLHWASAADVPLPEARHKWLKARNAAKYTEMADFKRHEDRMAVCSYTLTGDMLGEGQRAEVGSLAMWSVPQGSPPLEDGESVLQSVDINALAGRALKGDVMQELSSLATQQLKQVRGWLCEGKIVEVDLRCAFVESGAPVVKGSKPCAPAPSLDLQRP